nr:calmodulin [Gastrodia elata]
MEKKASTTCPLSLELIGFIILESILSFFNLSLKLSKRFFSFSAAPSAKSPKSPLLIKREELELVLENIGLAALGRDEADEVRLKDFVDAEELAAMFEEKEPSLEEVKEAFSVFDENGDGHVDAGELQRVLRKLGFEGLGLDSCLSMIEAHDLNGDGVIDFAEFVKFMESSFC